MIFYILIAASLAAGVFAFYKMRQERWYFSVGGSIGWSIFVIAISAVISFFIIVLLTFFLPDSRFEETKTDLVALGTDSETKGQFFLGSGVINENAVYQYINQGDDGAFRMETIRVSRAAIFEDATDTTAHMVEWNGFIDYWWFTPVAIDSGNVYETQFHVPAGSVKVGYNVAVE